MAALVKLAWKICPAAMVYLSKPMPYLLPIPYLLSVPSTGSVRTMLRHSFQVMGSLPLLARRFSAHFYRRFTSSSCQFSSDSETSHFNKLAESWWDLQGPQRILHKMNLIRMDFIRQTLRNNIQLNDPNAVDKSQDIYVPGFNLDLLPNTISDQIVKDQQEKVDFEYNKLKLKCLDIGCGGGILTESLARLNVVQSVKGLDLADQVLQVAKQHKKLDEKIDSKISYQLQPIETLDSQEKYNVITMFEILEHVDNPNQVLLSALDHLNDGGILFLSTINKDFISWFTTIFIGEYLLKIVPIGTHTLDKYIPFTQLKNLIDYNPRYHVINSKGGMYLPLYGWYLNQQPNIGNYFMAIKKK